MPQSLLQTPFWAQFKAGNNWRPITVADTSVLLYPLPLGFAFAYAPEVSDKDWGTWLPRFNQELRRLAKTHRLIFARLELLEPITNQTLLNQLRQADYHKAFEWVQPEYRQIIDIRPDAPTILANMKPKGRYNIHLAERHQVTVSIHQCSNQAAQDAQLFHQLFKITAERNRFGIRPVSYFQQLLQTLYSNQSGVMAIASFNNQPLAALIISFYDSVASYLYGASSNSHREVMAPYLAHWQVIQEAKQRRCHSYDLLSVAPPDEPNHKHANFTRFKQQFGGQTIQLIGSWDLLFHPIWYMIFRLVEKSRRNV